MVEFLTDKFFMMVLRLIDANLTATSSLYRSSV